MKRLMAAIEVDGIAARRSQKSFNIVGWISDQLVGPSPRTLGWSAAGRRLRSCSRPVSSPGSISRQSKRAAGVSRRHPTSSGTALHGASLMGATWSSASRRGRPPTHHQLPRGPQGGRGRWPARHGSVPAPRHGHQPQLKRKWRRSSLAFRRTGKPSPSSPSPSRPPEPDPLPTLSRTVPAGPQWVQQIKHDGYRFICRRDGNRVRAYSRWGKDWSDKVPAIVHPLASRPGLIRLGGASESCMSFAPPPPDK